jgi:hypothetical protein
MLGKGPITASTIQHRRYTVYDSCTDGVSNDFTRASIIDGMPSTIRFELSYMSVGARWEWVGLEDQNCYAITVMCELPSGAAATATWQGD